MKSAPVTPSKSPGLWNRLRGGTASSGPKTANPVVRKKLSKPSKAEVHQLDPSPWLGTLVLGLWDNTCGPRIDQVFLGTQQAMHDEELLSYAVRLTLASEIGHQSSALTQKFHLFSELSTMIVSTSFGVTNFEGSFKYALIVLCDSALLPRYLQLADVVQVVVFCSFFLLSNVFGFVFLGSHVSSCLWYSAAARTAAPSGRPRVSSSPLRCPDRRAFRVPFSHAAAAVCAASSSVGCGTVFSAGTHSSYTGVVV
jgi:hypothetical protein